MRNRIITVLLPLILLFCGCQKQAEDPQNVYEKYRNSVVLIKTQYYYSIIFNNGFKLYFTLTGDDQSPKIYLTEKEAIDNANLAFGTGFFIGREGEIATNRHVANPINKGKEVAINVVNKIETYKEDLNTKLQEKKNEQNKINTYWNDNYLTLDDATKNSLKTSYQNLQIEVNNINNQLNQVSYDSNNIKIEVNIVDIGVAYDNTYITSVNDFKSCVTIKKSNIESVDLAIIQLKDKRTPEYIKNILPLVNSDNKKDLSVNDDVFMIGYNQGIDLAITKEGIQSQFTVGKITQKPNDDRILYSIPTLAGSSGSPIIDRFGNLVAVNFAKISNTQGFNFGIPKSNLISFLKNSSTNITNSDVENISVSHTSSPNIEAPIVKSNNETPIVRNNNEEVNKSLIRGFVSAEDSRNFDIIKNFISQNMTRYWDIKNPSYIDLYNRYQYIWTRITQSRNIISEIKSIDLNTYDLYTEYEYFEVRKQRTISKNTRVRFHFDNNGKIDEIYGVE